MPLPPDDSGLVPSDLATLCAFPAYTQVYNVKSAPYSATGDGTTDDTVAIRSAVAAALAYGSGCFLYFPTGTYCCCPQSGDALDYGPIFDMSAISAATQNICVIGDGPSLSIIKGFSKGLLDPVTHWTNTGDSYSKIGRFTVFKLFSTNHAITNIQFRSLTINGQAGYTGDSTVGGNTITGDGWDLDHKGIRLDGANSIDDILIFNCILKNFRGEIVYAGGTSTNHLSLIGTKDYVGQVTSSNGSAVSCSANILMDHVRIGGSGSDRVYNATENFAVAAPQSTALRWCDIRGEANGLVHIGPTGTSLTVERCSIHDSGHGILLSEAAHDVSIRRNTFTGAGIINSHLGLYPGVSGFSGIVISDNTITSGVLLTIQDDTDGLVMERNTVNGASATLITGPMSSTGANFINNRITDGKDVGSDFLTSTQVGQWRGTLFSAVTKIGSKVDEFADVDTTIFPVSDATYLNANVTSGDHFAIIDPAKLSLYPAGFTTTFRIGDANWVLKKDSAWNTFAANVPVVSGVQIVMNASGKFDLVTSTPEPPAAVFAIPGNASVDVFWHSSPWGPTTAYKIHRGTTSGFTPGGGNLLHTESFSARQYTDSTASNGTTYYYKVIASNTNGDSAAVLATAYPDTTTAIVPAATLAGPVVSGLAQWWELNETSDGTAQVDRLGQLPTSFPREWAITFADHKNFGSDFMHSATIDGREVVDGQPTYGGAAVLQCSSPRMFGGYGTWTVLMRVQRAQNMGSDVIYKQEAGEAGSTTGRPPIEVSSYSFTQLRLSSFPLWGTIADTVDSTAALTLNEWATVAVTYDADVDRLSIAVVDEAGTITRDLGSTGIGPRQVGQFIWSQAFIASKFYGYVGPLVMLRNTASDAVLTWFNNSGSGQTFDKARFAPLPDPGPAPYSKLVKQKASFYTQDMTPVGTATDVLTGLYWLRPYPLFDWDSGLAATKGRYVWVYSSDHGHTGGPLIGFSDDPGVLPATWTYVLSGMIGGGSSLGPTNSFNGHEYDGAESVFLNYVADDANGRKFYLYGHCEQIDSTPPDGCRSDVNGYQTSMLWSSSDLSAWTHEGYSMANTPCPDGVNFDYNHTGYMRVFRPGELPGIDTYSAYHLTIALVGNELLTTSDDPKTFLPSTTAPDAAPQDPTTMFSDGAFFDATSIGNFVIAGNKVYDVVCMRAPNFRGIACTEMSLDQGTWRQTVADKRWLVGEANTTDFPELGYTQDVKVYYEDGVAHIYRLKGFAKEIHDEHTDYYTAVFDEMLANSARPVGAVIALAGSDVNVSIFDALPHRSYRVYRKTGGGSYSLLGTMPTTLDGDGLLTYTDSTASEGTFYTYQVRTLYAGSETAGSALAINTPSGGGGGMVTLNATGTEQYHAAATSFDYTGMTVAAGSDTALLLTLMFGSGSVTSITAHWDSAGANQSMTQIVAHSQGTATGAIFGLVAPATGNKTCHITWTGSAEIFACGIAFDGVDQTGGATTFPNSASSTTVTDKVTLTSATGNKVVGCQGAGASQGTPTGTTLYDDHLNGAVLNCQAEYDDGAATVQVGSSASVNAQIVAADVLALSTPGLVAGTLSADNIGTTGIGTFLYATVTDGTPPYSNQLKRGTVTTGPYSNTGSPQVGATASFSDSGLTANTDYYYVVLTTDGAAATATSNEVHVKTLASPAASTTHLSHWRRPLRRRTLR